MQIEVSKVHRLRNTSVFSGLCDKTGSAQDTEWCSSVTVCISVCVHVFRYVRKGRFKNDFVCISVSNAYA